MTASPGGSSATVENYLKVIFSIGERDNEPATTTRLAERLGISPSSVSGMLRRLADAGLVDYHPYTAVRLTDDGMVLALRVVRRHRLIEMYLVSELGFGWDEVHDEAEELEHAFSDKVLDRIDRKLGNPALDPHGDPIPQPDGTIQTIRARRLTTLRPSERGTLVRVDDHDPAVLRHLTDQGIGLGQPVEFVRQLPFGGPYQIRTDDTDYELAPKLAVAMWIS